MPNPTVELLRATGVDWEFNPDQRRYQMVGRNDIFVAEEVMLQGNVKAIAAEMARSLGISGVDHSVEEREPVMTPAHRLYAILIYLWTRDAKMPPNEETITYVRQHLNALLDTGIMHVKFSDEERGTMAMLLANDM